MRNFTRYLLLIFTFFAIFLSNFSSITQFTSSQNLVKYTGAVEHLFTHCLVAYPEIAFSKSNYMRYDYDKDCLTPLEFKRILNSLHKNNYILVKINDVYEMKNGQGIKKPLYLPKGKKPLIFSFDDVNYDSKKLGRGMVDKIILDNNNRLATFTKDAKNQIAYDNECIVILEQFVKDHPDFSHNGAKGLICLTGYDGILGYRTSRTSLVREKETKEAKLVVQKLKQSGWEFACHSYGHYHMSTISEQGFLNDIAWWQQEVEKLIGKTKIYAYPYGEYEIANAQKQKTPKHQILEQAGFELFLGVGQKYFFGYAPFHVEKEDRVLFMDRRPIDGNNLRKNRTLYSAFFDTFAVYDHENRLLPFDSE
jgi:peptidoglycan/xylan/chitin deacetylase (PgdA/CDA1 family)